MLVNVVPLGGAGEIGGSAMWIGARDLGVVVDFGARPGRTGDRAVPDLSAVRNSGLPVAALVLTHAHYDHVGALPVFHREYPNAHIHATPASVAVGETILSDSLSIQERNSEVPPLYTAEDVASLRRMLVPLDYGQPRVIARTSSTIVLLRFFRAGHILGAASPLLLFCDLERRQSASVLISGDVSVFDQPTIPGADLASLHGLMPDLLVLEGTYGGYVRGDLRLEEARYVRSVARIIERGGRVVTPAFAIGRGQNVPVVLRRAMNDPAPFRKLLAAAGEDADFSLPSVPIYIDGMVRRVGDHYHSFRQSLQPDLLEERRGATHVFFDAASDGPVRRVANGMERERLQQSSGPWIAVSSSGMVTGGAVVSWIEAIANDPLSAIFLSGYVDEEAPGAHLRKGGFLRLDDRQIKIECDVQTYRMSAHSDAKELEEYARTVAADRITLVHGERSALAALTRRLERSLSNGGTTPVIDIAEPGRCIAIDGRPMTSVSFALAAEAQPTLDRSADIRRLTGGLAAASSPLSAEAHVVSAVMRYGWGQPLAVEDLARLETAMLFTGPVARGEVDRTSALVGGTTGHLIRRRDDNRTEIVEPVRSRTVHSLSDLRRSSRKERGDHGRGGVRPEAMARLATAGIKPGDLVLCLLLGRVQPALALEPLAFGLRALSASGAAVDVNADSILARVGRWPRLGSTGDADVQMLERVHDAVAAYLREAPLATEQSADPEVLRRRLKADARSARLSPQSVAVAHSLLGLDRLSQGASFAEVARAVGERSDTLSADLLDALEELVGAEYLVTATDSASGAPRLSWAKPRVTPLALQKDLEQRVGSALAGALVSAIGAAEAVLIESLGRDREKAATRAARRERFVKTKRSVA